MLEILRVYSQPLLKLHYVMAIELRLWILLCTVVEAVFAFVPQEGDEYKPLRGRPFDIGGEVAVLNHGK